MDDKMLQAMSGARVRSVAKWTDLDLCEQSDGSCGAVGTDTLMTRWKSSRMLPYFFWATRHGIIHGVQGYVDEQMIPRALASFCHPTGSASSRNMPISYRCLSTMRSPRALWLTGLWTRTMSLSSAVDVADYRFEADPCHRFAPPIYPSDVARLSSLY